MKCAYANFTPKHRRGDVGKTHPETGLGVTRGRFGLHEIQTSELYSPSPERIPRRTFEVLLGISIYMPLFVVAYSCSHLAECSLNPEEAPWLNDLTWRASFISAAQVPWNWVTGLRGQPPVRGTQFTCGID